MNAARAGVDAHAHVHTRATQSKADSHSVNVDEILADDSKAKQMTVSIAKDFQPVFADKSKFLDWTLLNTWVRDIVRAKGGSYAVALAAWVQDFWVREYHRRPLRLSPLVLNDLAHRYEESLRPKPEPSKFSPEPPKPIAGTMPAISSIPPQGTELRASETYPGETGLRGRVSRLAANPEKLDACFTALTRKVPKMAKIKMIDAFAAGKPRENIILWLAKHDEQRSMVMRVVDDYCAEVT